MKTLTGMNKNKVITLLFLLFLVLALPIALILVQNRQNYEKNAQVTGGVVEGSLSPESTANLNPGDNFIITVNFTNLSQTAKESPAATAILQYDPNVLEIKGITSGINPCNPTTFNFKGAVRYINANTFELTCLRVPDDGPVTLAPNVATPYATFSATVKASAAMNQSTVISFVSLVVPDKTTQNDIAGTTKVGTYTVGTAQTGTPTEVTTATPTQNVSPTPSTPPSTGAYFRLTPAGHVDVNGQNIFKMEAFFNTGGKESKDFHLALKFEPTEFACAGTGVVDSVHLESNCNTGSDSYFVFGTKSNNTFSKVYNNEKIGEALVLFQGSVQTGTIIYDQSGLPNGTWAKDKATGQLITLTEMDDYVYTKGVVVTPTPPQATPTQPQNTPTPPQTTPTVTVSGGTISFKVKMREVVAVAPVYNGKTLNFKVQLVKAGQETQVFNPVPLVVGAGTYNQGSWTITLSGFSKVAGNYDVYIKGPKHLQKKFPNVALTSANSQTQDLTLWGPRYYLEGGDVVRGTAGGQDGVVNAMDGFYLIGCFPNTEEPVCVENTDLTFDGIVNTQDLNLLNNTIYSKWEDDEQQ